MIKLHALPNQAVFYLQIHYIGQSSDIVRMTVPGPVGDTDFVEALHKAVMKYSTEVYKDEDSLELTETMLDEIADMYGGSWDYLTLLGTVEVNGDGREFIDQLSNVKER